MDTPHIKRIKLLSSTRGKENIRCLRNFSLEDWASLKTRAGCFSKLIQSQDQKNLFHCSRWPIIRLPHNDLIPVLVLSHSPEN